MYSFRIIIKKNNDNKRINDNFITKIIEIKETKTWNAYFCCCTSSGTSFGFPNFF